MEKGMNTGMRDKLELVCSLLQSFFSLPQDSKSITLEAMSSLK